MYGETLDRCRNRQKFYFTWYLPRNGSSKKFHETDHITRCNACWNLFHSAAAHKFHLKAPKCNSGLINEIACCATCKKACVKPGLHVVVSGGFHFSYKARSPYSRLCCTCCPTGMTIWKQHRRTGRTGRISRIIWLLKAIFVSLGGSKNRNDNRFTRRENWERSCFYCNSSAYVQLALSSIM